MQETEGDTHTYRELDRDYSFQVRNSRGRQFAALTLAGAVLLLAVFYLTSLFEVTFLLLINGPAFLFVTIFGPGIIWASILLASTVLAHPKSTVLFLRKFGAQQSAAAISEALVDAIGSSFRLITLDDRQFVAEFESRVQRGVSRSFPAVIIVLFVLAAAASMAIATGGLGAAIVNTFGFIFAFQLFVHMAIAVFLLTLLRRRRLRRQSRVSVESTEQADRLRRSVERLNEFWWRSPLCGPRSTVALVRKELWPDVVSELSRTTSVILVEISEVTVSIVWEVQQALALGADKCLFAVQSADERIPLVRDGLALELDRLLGETPVLAYTAPRTWSERRTFRHRLLNALHHTTLFLPQPPSVSLPSLETLAWRRALKGTFLYLAIVIVSLVLSSGLSTVLFGF